MDSFRIRNKLAPTALSALSLLLALLFFSQKSIHAQEMADLALRARVNLYEKWNFDSVDYYFNMIIDKKDTPAFAYSDYGWYLLLKEQIEEGMQAIRKAAEMDSSDVQLTTWYSWALLWRGNLDEAKRWIDRALKLDAKNGEALHVASRIALETQNPEEALNFAKLTASIAPDWRAILPLVYAKIGEPTLAMEWAQNFSDENRDSDYWMLMETYIQLNMDHMALKFLQLAYDNRFPFMPWLRISPGLGNLPDYPLFKKIVNELHLPE